MPKRNRHRERVKATGGMAPSPGPDSFRKPAARPATPAARPAAPAARPAAPAARPAAPAARTPTFPSASGGPQAAGPPSPRAPAAARPPADPARKAQRLREKKRAYIERMKLRLPPLLETLMDRWPEAFPRDPARARPWAIGMLRDLAGQDLGQPVLMLKLALKRLAKSEAYQQALANGGPRYDLHGQPRGEVTETEQAKAAERLQALRAKAARAVEICQPATP